MIGDSWRANWERIAPFLDFPPEVRRITYTTNAIESLNFSAPDRRRHARAWLARSAEGSSGECSFAAQISFPPSAEIALEYAPFTSEEE